MNDASFPDPTKDPADLPPEVTAVIGIGISAISLASFLAVLAAIKPGHGGAYLVAIGGEDRKFCADILARAAAVTSLKVAMAEDGARLLPEHVYIAGPDHLLTLEADHLSVRDPPAGETTGAVDTLFASIARAGGRHAVAVLLNGLHAEGIVGLRAVQDCGGLTIGEWDPGFPDIRDTPDRIAAEIDRCIGSLAGLPKAGLRKAERARQDSAARLHSLMEGLPQLFWRADPRGLWTWVCPQWTTCTGQPLESALGEGWQIQAHPDDLDALRKAWAAATGATETQGFAADFRLMDATEGGWRWFRTRATAVRDCDGKIIEWLGTSTDINELLSLQEQQRALVGELQHRTRNLLSVVRQVSQRTLKSARDLEDFGRRFRDRLEMLARVQGLLSDLDGNSGLGFDALVQAALSAVGADSGKSVSLEGPLDVSLRPSAVQLLAMALHELATNAVQHGALGSAAGHLHIGWRIEGNAPSRLHILWRETGVSMPGAEPAWGQGRELIERALPYQLDAATTFRTGPDGILCTISLPI
ncbi:sensor histidine kinase [Rhodobacter sp. 24-YEA-8]|uniref:sensor histidine kinase n=1 Tax=Rhodobacter sp. 24-YEA-8 TaxID=1884310 RepID=UPI0008959158|nr:chemotaxis protein CheB [Rhodobacter sp. 24-YEA-8]SED76823.1 PAS domain S-box-containing protein [Rhodobacter sp. 24-YEA-8]